LLGAGPDADRRDKALIYLALEGVTLPRLFTDRGPNAPPSAPTRLSPPTIAAVAKAGEELPVDTVY
jgi:hypothetical protein